MIRANVIYNFIVMDTVITIINYDHSVITVVNYDPKTFKVQATVSLFISETFAQVEYLWGRGRQMPTIERSSEKVL